MKEQLIKIGLQIFLVLYYILVVPVVMIGVGLLFGVVLLGLWFGALLSWKIFVWLGL